MRREGTLEKPGPSNKATAAPGEEELLVALTEPVGRIISLDIREEVGKSRHPDKSPRRLPLENHHSGIIKEIIWKPKGSKYISQKKKRNVLAPPITSSFHTLCASLPGGD